MESHDHQRISASPEIDAYLAQLAARAGAELETWGTSAGGRALRALICGPPAKSGAERLKVMLIGSHHGGSEPAGGEALLVLARRLLLGDLRPLLAHLDIVILPNANPDGRDADSSRNASGVNLNRDYVLLAEPESRAIDAALRRHRPAVVLDAHESAVLKRKTLWREGYLTDFEAQFDIANNPVIPSAQRHFGEAQVLGAWCRRVAEHGLPAQRYIREILSTRQALTHGGVTIRKFRNKAGVLGSLSFLLETRLDPKDGSYPSYRNIALRVSKQLRCLEIFLALIHEHAATIRDLAPGPATPVRGQAVVLHAEYAPVGAAAVSPVPLRRASDGTRVVLDFPDHRRLCPHPPIALPSAYLVTAHVALIGEVLRRHGLHFETIASSARCQDQSVPAGSLRVPTAQIDGLLVPLLLETISGSSLFAHAEYREHERSAGTPFVFRVE